LKEQSLAVGLQDLKSFLIISIWSATVAVAVAVSMRVYDRGMASHSLVNGAEILAFGLIILILVRELLRLRGDFGSRILYGFFLSFLSLLIFVPTWVCALQAIPDPALLYWQIWQPYIQGHWQTDPVSKFIYFPIDYTTMDYSTANDRGKVVPRNFFVLDDIGMFEISKYDGRVISPSCANAKYSALRVEEKIYVVRLFIDDPDETSDPCLVTPMQKGR
jgi:hypothetical protein